MAGIENGVGGKGKNFFQAMGKVGLIAAGIFGGTDSTFEYGIAHQCIVSVSIIVNDRILGVAGGMENL